MVGVAVMTGNNSLIINKATMIQAIDFYLKERVFGPHVVVNVIAVVADAYADTFTVNIETSLPQTFRSTGVSSNVD